MLFKSLFLILSYECVPVTRLVEPVLVIDTGLARLDFAYLAHPPLLTSTLGQRALLDTQLFQYLVDVLVSWCQPNTALMCGAMEGMHHSCYNGIQRSSN